MSSPKPHHRGGCLLCGTRRDPADIATKRYDVYLVDEGGSRTRVGLCRDCYLENTVDYDQAKAALAECQIAAAQKVSPELAAKVTNDFANITFVSHERAQA